MKEVLEYDGRRFLNSGEVMGEVNSELEGLFLVKSVYMHPHVGFLIMKAVLEHP